MAMAMSYEIMLKLNSLVTIPIELFYAINLILLSFYSTTSGR